MHCPALSGYPLERMVGERCNDILLDTGLFIVGAVCE
jgi:hypothetical protein